MTAKLLLCLGVSALVAGLLRHALGRLGCWMRDAGQDWPWAGRCAGRGRVELAAACMTLSLLALPYDPLLWLGSLLLLGCLLLLAIIDLECGLLPDWLTLPLLWAGLLFNLFVARTPLNEAVLGAVGGYVVLWLLYWIFFLLSGREGLGYGDFKLLAALGAWLGVAALPLVLLTSALTGLLAGGILMLLGRMKRSEALPFGPFLAVSGWVAWIGGARLQDWMTWQSRWWG